MAQGLSNAGVKIWAWDLRGHGQSQGVRGSVKDFSQYVQDFEIFLKRVAFPEAQGLPLILLGHSMGGLIQLQAVLDDEDLKELPQILSAPMLGVAVPIPAWKSALSVAAYQVLPEVGLDNGILPEMLSSDPEVLNEFRRDPLRHTKISAGAYEGAREAILTVHENADYFTGKMLLVGPESDPVVSTPDFKKFAAALPKEQVQFQLFPSHKHEIFNDVGREDVYKVVSKFIKSCL